MTTFLNVMAKPTSYQCNLECEYCFYLEKEQYFHKKGRQTVSVMSDDVLRSYVKQNMTLNNDDEVTFAWQGGESTLAGLDFYRRAVRYQKKFANGKTVRNTLQTNGVLIDKEWSQFLRENDFLVGISIDGPKELHDVYRVSRGGKPTYERVIKGIEQLKQQEVPFNTLTTVNNINVHYPLEIYNHLKELGSFYHQYIPVVEQTTTHSSDKNSLIYPRGDENAQLTPFSIQNGKDYGRFLITLFDEWLKKDLGRVYIQHIEEMVRKWARVEGGICLFQKSCGQAMVLERNGDLFSCDHYVYPQHRLGNLQDSKIRKLVSSRQQQKFAREKSKISHSCKKCEFLFACNGGCPKHRLKCNLNGTDQNHLCPGYFAFFQHIDPVMRKIARDFHRTHAIRP